MRVSSARCEPPKTSEEPASRVARRADHAGIAAPEAADVVAKAVVPLQEGLAEIAELVAAGTDVPRFGDQHAVAKQRVGAHCRKQRRVSGEALLAAAEHGGKVEAEAVDAGLRHEVPKRVEDHLHHHRVLRGQRVAGAGVVDKRARIVGPMAVIGEVVEAAQRQRRALFVALPRVVEDDVEDDADAGLPQGGDGVPELGDAARREPRIERHEGDRVVTPGIGEAERGRDGVRRSRR